MSRKDFRQKRMRSLAFAALAATAIGALATRNAAAQAPAPELKPLGSHTATVTSIIHTPSGKYIATGSADQTIKVWDAGTGQELRILQGHTGPVLCVAASPDSRFFVSGAGDNTLRIWDAPQPDPLQVFEGHTAPVRAVAVSLDGQRFVTAGDDKLGRIWRLEDGKLMVALDGLTAPVHKAAYRNDNNQTALGDVEGVIRVYNTVDGKPEGVLGAHVGAVTGLMFHPNNQQLVTAGADGLVKVWRLPIPAPRFLADNKGPIRAVAITTDNQQALAADEGGVRVFSPNNGQPLRMLEGFTGPALSVAVSPNNALAAAGGAAGRIKFWNLGDGADRQYLQGHDGAVEAIAFHPDNQRFASAGDDGLIRLWRLPQPPTPLAGHAADVLAAAYSSNLQLAATGSADKTVRLWNPTNGQAIRQLTGHAQTLTALSFRNDAALLASGDAAGELRLWNANDGSPQGVLGAHGAAITATAIHPSGNMLATTGEDGLLKLWNLPLAAAKPLPGHNAPVTATAVTEDGAYSVTGGAEGVVRLFDNAAGNLVLQLPGHQGPVTTLAVSRGRIASGNDQGAITLWRFPLTAEGKLQPQLPADGSGGPFKLLGHAGKVNDLGFNDQREMLVSAGADGTVRTWNLAAKRETLPSDAKTASLSVASDDGKLIAVATKVNERPAILLRETASGKVVAELLGHTADIRTIAFSRDGARLISGAADKTARLWDLADAKFPQLAQFDSPAEVTAVALSDDGSQVFVGGADNAIRRWSAAGQEAAALAGHTGAVTGLVARGGLLFSASQDATVRVWNAQTGAAARTISHGAAVIALAVSGDGAKIASAGSDNSVKLWNAADGAAVATLPGQPSPALRLAMNVNGSRLVSTAADGLRTWDAAGRLREFTAAAEPVLVGANLAPHVAANMPAEEWTISAAADGSLRWIEPSAGLVLTGHDGAVNSVAVSLDGKLLLTGGADKIARLWSADTGEAITTLAGPAAEVTSVAASPASHQFAAATADGKLYQWTLPAALPKEPLQPERVISHAAPLRDVAFGDAGRLLTACGDDGLVRVYDSSTGYELERFSGHQGVVPSLTAARTARILLSGGADNTARVWTMSLVRTIVADKGKTHEVAFTPDGAQIVTAGDDMVIKFWNAEGKELRRIPAGKAPLVRLAMKNDSTQLAALDGEGRATVWKTEDGAVQFTLESPAAAQAAPAPAQPAAAPPPTPARGGIAFTADGQKLLVAHGNRLRLVAAATGLVLQQFEEPQPIAAAAAGPDNIHLVIGLPGANNNATVERFALERTIAAHEGPVHSLAISPDGAALLSGGADKTIRLWKWDDGAAIRQYAGSQGPVSSVAFSQDGAKVIAGGDDGKVRLWPVAADPANAPVAPQSAYMNSSPVRGVCSSADNTKLAACGDDGVLRVWDLASGKELERFVGHDGAALALAFSTDGATLVSGGADKSARAWSLSGQRVIVADDKSVEDLALMAGGAHAVTAGASVKRWNLGDGQLLREFPAGEARYRALAVRTDETQLAASDAGGKLSIWNPNDGLQILQFKTASPIHGLGYSPDNLRLIAMCEDQHIRFYNPLDGLSIHEIASEKPVHAAVFTRDARRAISVGDDGARLWAFVSPDAVRVLGGHGAPVYAAAVSPDGRWIVSASGDQTLRIWDAATGAQVKQMNGHVGAVYSAAFSADGALVVSCGADKSVRLWDVLSGRQLKQIPASDASLYSVAFHPDGRRVAAAGLDKKIRLYDVITGELQTTLSDHNDYVNRVAYNGRGDRLLSVGYGGNLVLRDAAGQPLYQAQLHRVSNFADLSPDGARLVVSVGNGDVFTLETPSNTR